MTLSAEVIDGGSVQQTEHEKIEFKPKLVWLNVFRFAYLHTTAFYGLYLALTSAYGMTSLFSFFYANIGGLGITAGAHRLWSHRSYKARSPLRILLMILCSIAGQNDIYVWCRDHRVHHKFTETNADPHNIRRGFFFAHIGWMIYKKHPDVIEKGRTIDLDDLWADPVVRFHKKFYIPMVILFNFSLPIMIPVWCWNETLWNGFFVAFLLRYFFSLHIAFLVNSAAHKYGDQPFNKHIEASENTFVSFFALGEGWHNYHHVFPWDYSTSELGYTANISKLFIDFMAMIGQAYDLKTTKPELVKNMKLTRGDGSRVRNVESNYTKSCEIK